MSGFPTEPRLHSYDTQHTLQFERLLTLIPAAIWAVILFGSPALLRILLSALTVFLLDAVGRYVQGRFLDRGFSQPFSVRGAVLGVLIAFAMPSDLPIGLLLLADLLTVLVLQVVRTEANLPFSLPALIGCILLLFPSARSYPLLLDSEEGERLLACLRAGQTPNLTIPDMLFGRMDGNMGEVASLLLLLGAGYLLVRRIINWRIPLAGIVAGAVASYLIAPDTITVYYFVGAQLFSGSFLLVLLYYAADRTSAPLTSWAELCYGALFGVLTIFIRHQTGLDGSLPAMLIVSLLSRPLDRFLAPLPFGGRR